MAHKELVYLKGYAKGRGFHDLLKVIHIVNQLHEGQTRKTGEPYVQHPTRVTAALVALGIHDETTLAVSFAHDIFEDCDITTDTLIHHYGLPSEMVMLMKAMSKIDISTEYYYHQVLEKDVRLVLCKVSDRCHNVSSMSGAFSKKKMEEYIKETREYVLPLCHKAKNLYPEYSDQLFTMKYHIESITDSIENILNLTKE